MNNVVLIGAGYWGTNIAKNLIKLRKKLLFMMLIQKLNIIKIDFPTI